METLTIHHQVALAGQVTDAQTGVALGGVQVQITAAPDAFTAWLAARSVRYGAAWKSLAQRPDRTTTTLDGYYHFLDLPAGAYTIAAQLLAAGSRYGSAQATASVTAGEHGGVTMASIDLALPPTAISGTVTDAVTHAAIALASVRVQDSGEVAYSDRSGNYALVGVEAGTRTLRAGAPGFADDQQTTTLASPGAAQTLDFTLTTAP